MLPWTKQGPCSAPGSVNGARNTCHRRLTSRVVFLIFIYTPIRSFSPYFLESSSYLTWFATCRLCACSCGCCHDGTRSLTKRGSSNRMSQASCKVREPHLLWTDEVQTRRRYGWCMVGRTSCIPEWVKNVQIQNGSLVQRYNEMGRNIWIQTCQ